MGIYHVFDCGEKLLQFAEGPGTRVAFADLKILGAVLTVPELTTVQEASNQLDRLYPPGYSAAAAGSAAAYREWVKDPVLRVRTKRADQLLRPALRALGGIMPSPDRCNHT